MVPFQYTDPGRFHALGSGSVPCPGLIALDIKTGRVSDFIGNLLVVVSQGLWAARLPRWYLNTSSQRAARRWTISSLSWKGSGPNKGGLREHVCVTDAWSHVHLYIDASFCKATWFWNRFDWSINHTVVSKQPTSCGKVKGSWYVCRPPAINC